MTTCYFSRRCYLTQLVLVITDDVCLNTNDSLVVWSKGDTVIFLWHAHLFLLCTDNLQKVGFTWC
jgi:hypothetical protein